MGTAQDGRCWQSVRCAAKPDATALEIGRFAALIAAHFKHRRERVPVFTDESLSRLTMPVLAIVGARDALLDSEGTRRRLEAQVAQATVRMLPDAGHVIRATDQSYQDVSVRRL